VTTTAIQKRGPYVEWDGPGVFLPASDYTLNEARHEASLFAMDTIGGDGRARYLGKKQMPLHEHDEPWENDDECPSESAWCFETYEGTWRW
jgi:hypothetical protein